MDTGSRGRDLRHVGFDDGCHDAARRRTGHSAGGGSRAAARGERDVCTRVAWTPLKETCLKNCSNPSAFLARYWRAGRYGALVTGFRHGLFCLGCCWLLMALLFVAGIMNVVWVGGIALLVLLEKTLSWRRVVTCATGAALVIWGGTIFVHIRSSTIKYDVELLSFHCPNIGAS